MFRSGQCGQAKWCQMRPCSRGARRRRVKYGLSCLDRVYLMHTAFYVKPIAPARAGGVGKAWRIVCRVWRSSLLFSSSLATGSAFQFAASDDAYDMALRRGVMSGRALCRVSGGWVRELICDAFEGVDDGVQYRVVFESRRQFNRNTEFSVFCPPLHYPCVGQARHLQLFKLAECE